MWSQNSRVAKELLSAAYSRWSDVNASRLGASLAYFALLSLAPLSILLVAICAVVFGKSESERYVLRQAVAFAGSNGASTVKTLIDNTRHRGTGIFATLVALLTLLFGASGVFVELRASLNAIWGVSAKQRTGVRGVLWQRLAAFAMVLSLGFMLLVSLSLSAVIVFIERFATDVVPLPAAVTGEVLNLVISLLALSVLFALVFRFVPETVIMTRDVLVGGVATAVLFMAGRSLLALYLSTSAVGSAYGAAGSIVALVVWVYYSAQIFFFGAVFTRIYAERFGSTTGIDTLK